MEKAKYQQFSRRLAVILIIFGILTLTGWILRIPALYTLLPSPRPTSPVTALCIVLLGGAVWLENPLESPKFRIWGKLLAGMALLFTSTIILKFSFGMRLLFGAPFMLEGSAFGLLISEISLLLVEKSGKETPPYQYLSIFAFALGIFGLTNFAFAGESRMLPLFFMSSGSAIAIVILAIATLFLYPDRGIMSIITSETSAGMMLRRLFPALLGMFVIRWLRLMGENFHYFSSSTGEGVVAVIYFILGFGMVWWSGVLLYHSDIRRQKMESQALEQAQHIESILASTSDALYFIDNDGRYRYVSRKGAEFLGRPTGDILGKTGEELGLPLDINQKIATLCLSVQQSGQPLRGVFHYPLGKTYEYIFSPVKDSQGTLQGVVASLHDITEREQMEEEVRESRERFSKAFRLSPNPLFISHLSNGRFADVNDAVIRAVGFTYGELIGHSSVELGILTPEERTRLTQSLQDQKALIAFPFEFYTKQKEKRQGLYSADTFEEHGECFIIGSITDITERAKADQERQQLQKQQIQLLQEAARMKDEFLSVISHELRTPLNAVEGFGSLLEDGMAGPLTPLQRDYVGKILKGGDRMLVLIDDLLDFARIQAGSFSISPETADYNALVAEILESFTPELEEKGVALTKDIQVHVPVYLDRRRIQQVLANLISNALKFSEKHGKIQVKARVMGDRLITEVCDNGKGIAPEDLAKLFIPFKQLDMSLTRKVGGIGLGLSISKSIVEAHGGSIQACSPGLGKGTTVKFELPLKAKPFAE